MNLVYDVDVNPERKEVQQAFFEWINERKLSFLHEWEQESRYRRKNGQDVMRIFENFSLMFLELISSSFPCGETSTPEANNEEGKNRGALLFFFLHFFDERKECSSFLLFKKRWLVERLLLTSWFFFSILLSMEASVHLNSHTLVEWGRKRTQPTTEKNGER